MSNSLNAVVKLSRANGFSLSAARDELRQMFIELALAVDCYDLNLDTNRNCVEDRLSGLFAASGSVLAACDHPDDAWRSAWISGYKQQMQCTQEQADEAYVFSDINWDKVRAPMTWIADVGFCAGVYGGITAKTYFRMCADNDAKAKGAGV